MVGARLDAALVACAQSFSDLTGIEGRLVSTLAGWVALVLAASLALVAVTTGELRYVVLAVVNGYVVVLSFGGSDRVYRLLTAAAAVATGVLAVFSQTPIHTLFASQEFALAVYMYFATTKPPMTRERMRYVY